MKKSNLMRSLYLRSLEETMAGNIAAGLANAIGMDPYAAKADVEAAPYAVKDAVDKAKDAAGKAKDKAKDTVDKAKDAAGKAKDAVGKATDKAKDAVDDKLHPADRNSKDFESAIKGAVKFLQDGSKDEIAQAAYVFLLDYALSQSGTQDLQKFGDAYSKFKEGSKSKAEGFMNLVKHTGAQLGASYKGMLLDTAASVISFSGQGEGEEVDKKNTDSNIKLNVNVKKDKAKKETDDGIAGDKHLQYYVLCPNVDGGIVATTLEMISNQVLKESAGGGGGGGGESEETKEEDKEKSENGDDNGDNKDGGGDE